MPLQRALRRLARLVPRTPARPLRGALALASLLPAACSTSTPSATPAPLTADAQATIEGTLTRIETAPWAYDGNALVSVDTAAHGTVTVQLPARWNLCKAPAPQLEALQVGNRVRAIGTVSADGALVVCEQASHRLEPLAR